MKPFEIIPDLYWIGALHPDLRLFDIIMHTKNGTTYNSYLIKNQKTAIIDTVKAKYTDQYLQHISELCDLQSISYIIVQHTEPDHSGSLAALIQAAPKAEIICAKPAVKYVQNTLNLDIPIRGVQNGETLTIGDKTLGFLITPFLHWPDTMMTYLEQDQVLFPCDVYASHFCDSLMFDDLIQRDFWPDFTYYFEMIMRPFKKNYRSAWKKLETLPLKMIAPSHGPILRHDLARYLKAYEQWTAPARQKNRPQAIIFFASAHGNTEKMAHQIGKTIESKGIDITLFDAVGFNLTQNLEQIENADALIFGSPTINNDAVKPIWDILTGLTTIDVKGKMGASFGSIGWSGEAVEFIDVRLTAMKMKVPVPGLTATLVPSAVDLEKCHDFGAQLAQSILENSQTATNS